MDHLLWARVNNKQHLPKGDFFSRSSWEHTDCDCISWGGREEDKKINSDKSSFDVLDLILITSIFAANWPLLSWGSKFTKSKAALLCSLFVGVIMKLSNFGSSLSGCQILGVPCQCCCQERVTWFQSTFALWEPNIPFEFRLILVLLCFTKTLLSLRNWLSQCSDATDVSKFRVSSGLTFFGCNIAKNS